jgi:hypothetical protein
VYLFAIMILLINAIVLCFIVGTLAKIEMHKDEHKNITKKVKTESK